MPEAPARFWERYAPVIAGAVVLLFLALAGAFVWLAESNATLSGEIKAEQKTAAEKAYHQCMQGNTTRHKTGAILFEIINLSPVSYMSVRDPVLVRKRDQELTILSARIQANYSRSDSCGSPPS